MIIHIVYCDTDKPTPLKYFPIDSVKTPVLPLERIAPHFAIGLYPRGNLDDPALATCVSAACENPLQLGLDSPKLRGIQWIGLENRLSGRDRVESRTCKRFVIDVPFCAFGEKMCKGVKNRF